MFQYWNIGPSEVLFQYMNNFIITLSYATLNNQVFETFKGVLLHNLSVLEIIKNKQN